MGLSFAEWEAQRKGGGAAPGVAVASKPNPLAVENPSVDALLADAKGTLSKADAFSHSIGADAPVVTPPSTHYTPDGPDGEFRPSKDAFLDTFRYLGHEARGAVGGAGDALKNLLHVPGQVAEGYTKAIPTLAKDPSLLMEAPRAIADAGERLATHPDELGSLLGQAVTAKASPMVLKGLETAVRVAPDVVGAPLESIGRGSEALGKSAPMRAIGRLGPWEAVARGDWKGLAAAAVPPALEYGGRALQSVGSKIRTMDPLQGIMRAVAPVRNLMNTDVSLGGAPAADMPTAPYMPRSTESAAPVQLPSEYNDFNYEKPPTRWSGNRPSPDALLRLTDADPGPTVDEMRRTRAGLGANPRLNKSSVLEGLRTATARSHAPGRSFDPDIQDTLNEIMRKHYVRK